MIDLERIKNQILQGKEMENVLSKINWREFENFIAEIFRKHRFSVNQSFRFKTKGRHEIDILAMKGDIALAIDCKHWSAGRHKGSALDRAVKEQEDRIEELKRFIKNNAIVEKMLKVEKTKFYSLIVTLMEEELVRVSNSFIVPAWKLNSFLLEQINYL